jgi:hypothetical protein
VESFSSNRGAKGGYASQAVLDASYLAQFPRNQDRPGQINSPGHPDQHADICLTVETSNTHIGAGLQKKEGSN